MACPRCGCKTTYYFDSEDEYIQEDYEMDRCAACGCIFYLMDCDGDEDDFEMMERGALF